MRILLSVLVLVSFFMLIGTAQAQNITLKPPDTQNTDDVYVNQDQPTINTAASAFMNIGRSVVAPLSYSAYVSVLKWDLSNIPDGVVIDDVTLLLNQLSDTTTAGFYNNVSTFGTLNTTWMEETLNYNSLISKVFTASNNYTYISQNATNIADNEWIKLNVTNWVKWVRLSNTKNVTILVNETNTTNGGYVTYNTKEAAADVRPILNVSYHALELVSNTWDYRAIETKNAYFNLSLLDSTGGNVSVAVKLFINGTEYAYTSLNHTNNYYNYTFYGPPAYLPGAINFSNYTFWWNVSIGTGAGMRNDTLLAGSINGSQEVSRLRLVSCAAPILNQSLNFSILDEDDLATPVKSVFGSTFSVWIDSGNRSYSFSQSGSTNYSYCIYPGFASPYYANISLSYSNTSYSPRNFFTQASSYTNTTSNINLYLLSTTNSTNIFFTVYDQNKIPQPNVVIEALRYYPSTGNFVMVTVGKTGYDGMTVLPLELYQYYQYLMVVNGFTLASTSSSQLSSITQNLYISPSNYVQLFDYVNGIYAGCNLDNTTKVLTCTINDQSGKLGYSVLSVSLMKAANYSTPICTKSSTAATASLACNLTAYNSSNMYYTFTGVFSGTPTTTYTFSSGAIDWASGLWQPGLMGVLLAMILTITLFFAGMTNSPTTGMLLANMGIIVSSLSGLISIGWGNLFPMILVAVIIIYKLEE